MKGLIRRRWARGARAGQRRSGTSYAAWYWGSNVSASRRMSSAA